MFDVADSTVSLLLAALLSGTPVVMTNTPTALGTTGFSVNGSVHPRGLPTTWYFEYGLTTAYGARTPVEPLPPRLAAYYRVTWDEPVTEWGTRLTAELPPEGGVSGGFLRVTEPSADDFNHLDGIGMVHLLNWLYIGPLEQTVQLGGGDADLRDAKVSVWLRGHDWKANGSEVMWWSQSQSNPEAGETPAYRRANWAYSGVDLGDALVDGEWHQVSYRLRSDSTLWTYAGTNREFANGARYAYWPIGQTLRHANYDFFHMATYVDESNPPTGSVDFDEFRLVYHNRSLVFPSNGARLVSAPPSVGDDPSRLTDGWRSGEGHTWHGAATPPDALELVYAFDETVTVNAVQIHQNPEWPARDVDVAVSLDGATFRTIATLVLPERGVPTDNFGFDIARGLSAQAKYLKVSIRSGYRRDSWGLGEIEVFGDGPPPTPENEPNFVSADITGLRPGMTIHYRLVATNANGVVFGPDQTFTTPIDESPLAETRPATRVRATSARLDARTNAMGRRTFYAFEYGPDASSLTRTVAADAGREVTPRLSFVNVQGLQPGTTYSYRVIAWSEAGTTRGELRTFQTPAN